MDSVQTLTPEAEALEAVRQKIESEKLLKYQQDIWVEFNAVGGLIIEADGSFKKSPRDPSRNYTVTDLAEELGVSRQTLYGWSKSIPSFWERVAKVRKEVGGRARVQKVWNGLFLKASTGNPQAAALFLANFDPDFRMPTEKVEHDLGNGMAELIQKAHMIAKQQDRKVIDVSASEQSNPSASA